MQRSKTKAQEKREKLTSWFDQMMFVSGETAEPSTETTGMIEELVRQQVIEMASIHIRLGCKMTLLTAVSAYTSYRTRKSERRSIDSRLRSDFPDPTRQSQSIKVADVFVMERCA